MSMPSLLWLTSPVLLPGLQNPVTFSGLAQLPGLVQLPQYPKQSSLLQLLGCMVLSSLQHPQQSGLGAYAFIVARSSVSCSSGVLTSSSCFHAAAEVWYHAPEIGPFKCSLPTVSLCASLTVLCRNIVRTDLTAL